jgi:hypothetical protein
MVREYNQRHMGSDYSLSDMKDERKARAVAEWILDWLEWRYREEPQPVRDALIISGYHCSHRWSDKRIIKWTYVQDVAPFLVRELETGGHFVSKGRKFAKLQERIK